MGVHFLSKSRGIGNLCSRIGTILSRFGISSKKFSKLLFKYRDVTKDLGCVPTFPITAVILKRHPDLIRKLSDDGMEFAIHGYVHTDYQALSFQEQLSHYEKALDIFRICGIPYTGFRAPFLRTNSETARALSCLDFNYDSSQAAYWNVIDQTKYSDTAWSEHDRLLDFYQSQPAQDIPILPRFNNGILEIPVSIPDDEVMVERLGIDDAKEISRIWLAVLQSVYDRGELFTLQLHPERITHCEEALADVIKQAKSLNPPVWITTLGQITEWWKEKTKHKFTIEPQGNSSYRVQAHCSEQATVLVKNCTVNAPTNNWFDGYQTLTSRDFVMEGPVSPVIGLAEDTSPDAVTFLSSEGYVTEKNEDPKKYGLHFNDLAQFSVADEKCLSERIEFSGLPILRYWRWPYQTRIGLTVTGDIDSITLIDFVLRICENWRYRRHKFEDSTN